MTDPRRTHRGKAKNVPERDTFMLPYQVRWIEDTSLLRLMEKSRRIGISYGTSYKLVRNHSRKKQTVDTWVSSRDEPTARLFIQDCVKFSRFLRVAAEDIGERVVDDESVHSIKFSNETEIHSVASNPDVFAGKGGDVVLDEFALRKDPRAVYAIAEPTTVWGGHMDIISTHRGDANYFNELCEEIKHKGNPKGFSHHKVTLQDALEQGFLWKLQQKLPENDERMHMDEAAYFDYQRSKSADKETFDQEYMCIPSNDASAFLSYDLISACELKYPNNLAEDIEETRDLVGSKGRIRTLSRFSLEEIASQPYQLFVGVDIARTGDLTVVWLAARVSAILVPLVIMEMRNVQFSRQEAELYRLLRLPRCIRCCIDQSGIGRQFTERAQERYGVYRVEGVNMTNLNKEELAYPVRAAFEDRTVLVPEDDRVRADLRAIKKRTVAGNIRFEADRSENGHSDRFWALALAINAASTPGGAGPIVGETAPRTTASRREYDDYITGGAVRRAAALY